MESIVSVVQKKCPPSVHGDHGNGGNERELVGSTLRARSVEVAVFRRVWGGFLGIWNRLRSMELGFTKPLLCQLSYAGYRLVRNLRRARRSSASYRGPVNLSISSQERPSFHTAENELRRLRLRTERRQASRFLCVVKLFLGRLYHLLVDIPAQFSDSDDPVAIPVRGSTQPF
jgi:hypothetical protein